MLRQLFLPFICLTALGLIYSPFSQALSKGNLIIAVEGVAPEGEICLSLFASSRGFPGERSQALQANCIAASDPVVTFTDLTPGSYAVAVFQDENGDRTLNRNGLGMPTERFGFSQNPQIIAGPPRFGEAAIVVAGAETSIQIRLQSLF
jgi:uncharacterized protein (DUF2141 family)